MDLELKLYSKGEVMGVAKTILRYMYERVPMLQEVKKSFRIIKYMHASACVDDWLLEFKVENEAFLKNE